VHVGHALHEAGKIAIVFGPKDEVPMVRHPTVSTDSHRSDAKRLFHDAPKGIEVLRLAKEGHSPSAPTQDMKQHSPRCNSRGAWHDSNLTRTPHLCHYMRLSPLYPFIFLLYIPPLYSSFIFLPFIFLVFAFVPSSSLKKFVTKFFSFCVNSILTFVFGASL
jgi:hypothetical protein